MKKNKRPKKSEKPWNTSPKLKPTKLSLLRNNTITSLTNKKKNKLKSNKEWLTILSKLNITLPPPNVMMKLLSLPTNGKLSKDYVTNSLKTLEFKNT